MDTLVTVPAVAPAAAHATEAVAREVNSSAVSWPAILAGTLVAAATSLMLLALGSGMGLASVSPWPGSGASATTVTVTAAIWLIVVQWAASGLGGYLTGRLRSKWVSTHTHEVFFRDTAHGLLTWALATVLGLALLASAVSSVIGGGVRAAVSTTSIDSGAAASAVNPYDVDMLFRSSRPDTNAPVSSTNAEATLIFGKALAAGAMPAADRSYLEQLIAARSGLSQEEAQRRLDAVMTQARTAADTARKAGAMASLYFALSMLVGAFVAGVAAAIGGRMRDAHP